MAPLSLAVILFLLLLLAQLAAIVAAVRNGLWRAVPAWIAYLFLVTAHLVVGLVATAFRKEYPVILLYFEPLIILGQIAFTFETGVKMGGFKLGTGSPESKLLMWLIPLVPAAIVMPIEIGFIQDALANWHSHESESLDLVYNVRRFLSLTLLVLLVAIPVTARMSKRPTMPAILVHHYVITAYVACSAIGYLCKVYFSGSTDFYLTNFFFVVGPMVCFLTWCWKMWKCQPADFESAEPLPAQDLGSTFDCGALQNA